MTASRPTIKLEKHFYRQVVRWALAGFALTLAISILCILYSAKTTSERQLLTLANAATHAFRPQILEDNVREAEFQMRSALGLKPGESSIVRSPDLKAIYPLQDSDNESNCKTPMQFCWTHGFRSLSILVPIYFDTEKSEGLFGYLELTVRPQPDMTTIFLLIGLLLSASLIQALGMATALRRSARDISSVVSKWAEHLKTNPQMRPSPETSIPFENFRSLQGAIDGLHMEISKLQESAAKEAKTEAQYSMIREISHDLKTPHSLLARYVALLVDTVEKTGRTDEAEVKRIETTLKRMGDLIRQVQFSPANAKGVALLQSPADAVCNLSEETLKIVEDLRQSSDAREKSVSIDFKNQMGAKTPAYVSRIAYYRIVENIVRNAIEAVDSDSGHIGISIESPEGLPTLIVQDNGCGIDPALRDKIFAFDFTTKISRGTGLGLGIVEKLCQEFGANLSFDSAVGKGTRFTIAFRRVETEIPVQHFSEVSHVQI
jgi:signal transduction histidine kinase